MSKPIALWFSVVIAGAVVATAQNTVTFDNQSGEAALVKLVGPTCREVEVPNGSKQTVDASAGRYIIKVRYGVPGRYRYTKGQEFEVKETTTTRSTVTITLHKVVAGNYDSRPISEEEFGSTETKKEVNSEAGVNKKSVETTATTPSLLVPTITLLTKPDAKDPPGQFEDCEVLAWLLDPSWAKKGWVKQVEHGLGQENSKVEYAFPIGEDMKIHRVISQFDWRPSILQPGPARIHVSDMIDTKVVAALNGKEIWSRDLRGMNVLSPLFNLEKGHDNTIRLSISVQSQMVPVLGRGKQCFGGVENIVIVRPTKQLVAPKNADGWVSRGMALSKQNQREVALVCYDRALGINPKHTEALSNKGIALQALGRHKDALECHSNILENDPKNVAAWCQKAKALWSLRREKEALTCCNQALEINPKYVEAWRMKGYLLAFKLSQGEEGLVCYSKAVEIDPTNAILWRLKGNVLDRLGRGDEALSCSNRAIELDPDDPDSWSTKGRALRKLKRYPEARKAYEKAVELGSTFAQQDLRELEQEGH